MAEIAVYRDHGLGLPKARSLARQWADEMATTYGVAYTVVEADSADTVAFSRSGIKGRLVAAADHFDLQMSLGFLLSAFSTSIVAEIEKNIDLLLGAAASDGGASAGAPPPRAAPAKAPRAPAKAAGRAAKKR